VLRITNIGTKLAWKVAKWCEMNDKIDLVISFLARFLACTGSWGNGKLMSLEELDRLMECQFLYEAIKSPTGGVKIPKMS
jgi:hypothetical protein